MHDQLMTIRDIAVGIDGSGTADDTLGWAIGLASAANATVHAVHAWAVPYGCTYPGLTPSSDALQRRASTIVQETVARVAPDEHIESVVVEGVAGHALITHAQAADLLAIGRTGANLVIYSPHFGLTAVGGTARYCANHATSVIAAVPPGSSWVDAPNVVVGVDGSPTSLAALRWATRELPQDATIHAVSAVRMPTAEFGVPVDAEMLDPIVELYRQELARQVRENTEPAFISADRAVQLHTIVGHAEDALIDPGFPCDLIVIGEHGQTAAASGVLGSIADHTMRSAPVPLIIVPLSAGEGR